ncbi:hypothetical protein Y032_0038g3551 [Ancylostoma ceylanicum]|uniref:G-protein coupled receptors family 1 profile domain-containing protein n=1 Tax=Ancylostoma ceylanicum TaxID=53326 RepID=A0A016UHY6_9BILA|nr:hypothetical protein Y032_0038g3551 [Ancylostoma ceylanicum]
MPIPLVNEGIADVAVMINYSVFVTLRTTNFFNDLFWNLQAYYIGTWCFVQYYYSVVLRALGILLITAHRYITMCKHGSSLEHWMNSRMRWILVLVHWIVPPAYILPFLFREAIPFDDSIAMDPIPKKRLISLANLLSVAFVVPSFTVCILCYLAILRKLYQHRVDLSVSLRRERLVCIQMMGVFIAFALVVLYNILQFNFSLQSNVGPVIQMRVVFPLISSFLSYVNPWMMILTTQDLRRKLLDIYGLREKRFNGSSTKIASTKFVRNQSFPLENVRRSATIRHQG